MMIMIMIIVIIIVIIMMITMIMAYLSIYLSICRSIDRCLHLNHFYHFHLIRGVIFEIPTQARLEKAENKASLRKASARKGGNKDDNNQNKINESNTERILIENNRREKEAAVIIQQEDYELLRDGEKVNEELYHNLLCAAFMEMLKKLINEIRGSQIYVDGEGIVTKRITAKTALRKVDKTV